MQVMEPGGSCSSISEHKGQVEEKAVKSAAATEHTEETVCVTCERFRGFLGALVHTN